MEQHSCGVPSSLVGKANPPRYELRFRHEARSDYRSSPASSAVCWQNMHGWPLEAGDFFVSVSLGVVTPCALFSSSIRRMHPDPMFIFEVSITSGSERSINAFCRGTFRSASPPSNRCCKIRKDFPDMVFLPLHICCAVRSYRCADIREILFAEATTFLIKRAWIFRAFGLRAACNMLHCHSQRPAVQYTSTTPS